MNHVILLGKCLNSIRVLLTSEMKLSQKAIDEEQINQVLDDVLDSLEELLRCFLPEDETDEGFSSWTYENGFIEFARHIDNRLEEFEEYIGIPEGVMANIMYLSITADECIGFIQDKYIKGRID